MFIIRLSYIVFLHQTTTWLSSKHRDRRLSYIVILHQTTTLQRSRQVYGGCLISLFYIKPQLCNLVFKLRLRCLISLFYIKPQPSHWDIVAAPSCLISLFYIKPQRLSVALTLFSVVLYRYSTSNHNVCIKRLIQSRVVLYRYSTSNHNGVLRALQCPRLSYIVILHQTTTGA